MDAAIHLQHVSKEFKLDRQRPFLLRQFSNLFGERTPPATFTALSDVDLRVGEGETIGLVGANGSGKTTLLSIIAGTIYPTRGSVSTRGRVGPILELGSGFHQDLSGVENVVLNASLLGLTQDDVEDRLADIIAFSGIAPQISAPLRTYSTGMVARLAFAILAHASPDILIVDEALSVGDQRFRERCEDTINRFAESGTTVLLSSHDTDSLERLCGRVLWLQDGSVQEEGPATAVLTAYRANQGP
jgi:ABC-type polysaccharide/polyol phosphate transport system ATPase subunit